MRDLILRFWISNHFSLQNVQSLVSCHSNSICSISILQVLTSFFMDKSIAIRLLYSEWTKVGILHKKNLEKCRGTSIFYPTETWYSKIWKDFMLVSKSAKTIFSRSLMVILQGMQKSGESWINAWDNSTVTIWLFSNNLFIQISKTQWWQIPS